MLLFDGALGFALLILWIYCVFDVIATDGARMRNLPKMAWLLIVLFIPDIGSLAWLVLGRPEKAGYRPGDTRPRSGHRPVGPEDSASWNSYLDTLSPIVRDREEQALRRVEEEQRRRQERAAGGPAEPGEESPGQTS
jgi:hypothetical protein